MPDGQSNTFGRSTRGVVRSRGLSHEVDFTTDDGARLRKLFKTEAAANAHLDALRRGLILPGGVNEVRTLKDAFERTKPHWESLRSAHKLEANGRLALEHFGSDKVVVDITDDDVTAYRDALLKLGRSASTINHRLQALGNMLRIAKEAKAIAVIPTTKRPREVLMPPRYLTEDEDKLLIDWLTRAEYREAADCCAVLMDTGLRVDQECLNLHRIDLTRHPKTKRTLVYVRDPKGRDHEKVQRTVPATARAERILRQREAWAETYHVERLWALEYWALRRQFERARAALKWGDDVTLHTLRHTCASRLVQRGVDLFRVQQWMGHKDLDTTRRYAHLIVDHLLAGAEALETEL